MSEAASPTGLFDLSGRSVLVTGASSGIGAATVRLLGASGAKVVAHYSSRPAGAEAAVADIAPDRRLVVGADFTAAGSAAALWSTASEWAGGIDVLVNNAAVMVEVGDLDGPEAWRRAWGEMLPVNVERPIELMNLAAAHFVSSGGGVIIAMSSWAAQRGSGNPRLGAYAATKAALAAATKTAARTYAADGIQAFCIAPGAVATELTVRSAQTQGGEDAVRAGLATGELVPPEDVASVVAFLASGRARHLTGATLDVNGASYIR